MNGERLRIEHAYYDAYLNQSSVCQNRVTVKITSILRLYEIAVIFLIDKGIIFYVYDFKTYWQNIKLSCNKSIFHDIFIKHFAVASHLLLHEFLWIN